MQFYRVTLNKRRLDAKIQICSKKAKNASDGSISCKKNYKYLTITELSSSGFDFLTVLLSPKYLIDV